MIINLKWKLVSVAANAIEAQQSIKSDTVMARSCTFYPYRCVWLGSKLIKFANSNTDASFSDDFMSLHT